MTQTLFYSVRDAELLAWFRRVGGIASNASSMMREISGVLLDETEESLRLERDPATGRPWAKLKPETIEARRLNGHWPGRMLQVSGQLASSISRDHGPDFAQVGSNKEYAGIQQHGGQTKPHTIKARNKKALAFGGRVVKQVRHPGSTIPARPYFGISPAGNDEIVSIVDRYLLGG